MSTVSARILRAFMVARRWLSFYRLRGEAKLGKLSTADYCETISQLCGRPPGPEAGDHPCRLLLSFDDHPGRRYWLYLDVLLLPTPDQLAARFAVIPAEEGGRA